MIPSEMLNIMVPFRKIGKSWRTSVVLKILAGMISRKVWIHTPGTDGMGYEICTIFTSGTGKESKKWRCWLFWREATEKFNKLLEEVRLSSEKLEADNDNKERSAMFYLKSLSHSLSIYLSIFLSQYITLFLCLSVSFSRILFISNVL